MSEEEKDINLDWIRFYDGDEKWLGTMEDFESHWTALNYRLNEKDRKVCFRIAKLVVEMVIRGDLQGKGRGHANNRIFQLLDKAFINDVFSFDGYDIGTDNYRKLTAKYYDVIIRYIKSRKKS